MNMCKHVQVYTTSRYKESPHKTVFLIEICFLGYDTVQSSFRALYCLYLPLSTIRTGLSPLNQINPFFLERSCLLGHGALYSGKGQPIFLDLLFDP
jgi:hypothetical protein